MTGAITRYSKVIPEENSDINALLFFLETCLRELIIDKLTNSYGNTWYKQALPGGKIIDSYKNARTYEKSTPWVQVVPHHPIYYLDFPDLATIFERKDNWDSVFQHIFKRKEIIIPALRKVEPIRNKVAHNRKASRTDVDIVNSLIEMVLNTLGEEYAFELINRCTSALDLPLMIQRLSDEALSSKSLIEQHQPIYKLEIWREIKKAWWFDGDFLCEPIDAIYTFFNLIETYMSLDRNRGTGYKIEQWVSNQDIDSKYKSAINCIQNLLKEHGNG